ncbi:hypothetical protein HK096_004312 [Nowakowskiella sp. JEL0078]|nr:hypothetical protein HK096_004312 [Nowakowskiella sp. JEL0078]
MDSYDNVRLARNCSLKFCTRPSSLESGTTVWSCGIFLARFLLALLPDYHSVHSVSSEEWSVSLPKVKSKTALKILRAFKNARVIDLGTGTGIVGFACIGLNPIEVVCSDIAVVVKSNLIQTNKEINSYVLHSMNPKHQIRITPLSWSVDASDEIKQLNPPFDVICGADIVYSFEAVDVLVKTISHLSTSKTIVFISYENRDPTVWLRFINMMNDEGFVLKFVFPTMGNESLSNAKDFVCNEMDDQSDNEIFVPKIAVYLFMNKNHKLK